MATNLGLTTDKQLQLLCRSSNKVENTSAAIMLPTGCVFDLIRNFENVDIVVDHARSPSISKTESSYTAEIPALSWKRKVVGKARRHRKQKQLSFSRWESTPSPTCGGVGGIGNSKVFECSTPEMNAPPKKPESCAFDSSPLKKPVRRGSLDFDQCQRPLVLLSDVLKPSFERNSLYPSKASSFPDCGRISLRKPVRRASFYEQDGQIRRKSRRNSDAAALLDEALRLMDRATVDLKA